MKRTSHIKLMMLAFGLASFVTPASAQEVLPRPEQPFGGKIGHITKDSVTLKCTHQP